MKSPYSAHLFPLIALGAGGLGAALGAGGHSEASLWSALIASLALVVLAIRSANGYNTLLAVFVVFHALYGLSGPFAAVYGGQLPPIFTEPYETSAFLLNYSLATVGLGVGVLAVQRGNAVETASVRTRRPPRLLAQYAILLGTAASVMEIVNGIRAGGVAVVLQGKEAYQSLTTELTLDLPSNTFAMVATAMMAFALCRSRGSSSPRSATVSRIHVTVFVLTLLPLLTVVVLLGQRGLLLGWILITLVGLTYTVSVRRMSGAVIALGVAVYFAMGVIYANRSSRGAALYIGDWSEVAKSALGREALLHAFNPAANEFGITLGNFSEYLKAEDHQLALGRSYVVGLFQPLPSSLYPGKKPQQISYEFRDQVFPGEGERGSIVGTAYSSILEAYYNFREVGVFAVYVLVGMALVRIERHRARSESLWFALVYLMFLPSAVSFHRSSFSDAVITPGVLNAAVVVALWMVCSFVETCVARDQSIV